MKGSARAKNVDEIEMTVTLTGTNGEWKRLEEQLPATGHPSWRIAGMIRRMRIELQEQFEEEFDVE